MWKSDAQRKWGNSPAGIKALGKKGVKEFNEASKGMPMPEKMGSMTKHGHEIRVIRKHGK